MERHSFTTREISSTVRKCKTVKEWGIFAMYNDIQKRTKTRRLKFMRNGWPVPLEMREAIINEVKTELVDASNIVSIDFNTGMGHRGSYDYLEIIVSA